MRSGPRASLTEDLCNLAVSIRLDELPPDVIRTVKNCLLDWMAVTIYGAGEPVSQLAFSQLRQLGQLGDGPRSVTLVGRGERAGLLDAALLNGTASHAVDFDDTHPGMMGHPSGPVIAAALALCEAGDHSGAALIESVVAGIEVECLLGAVLNPHHYESGWHATGTLGTFGAAAAGARLLCSDQLACQRVLGLAASQASGLKISFGTMAKPLHVGRAASAGILAASLGSVGFTSHEAAVEAQYGYADLVSAGWDDGDYQELVSGEYRILSTLFKHHASCFLTHGTIEALTSIRRSRPLASVDVQSVAIEVDQRALNVCNIGNAKTGLEAKFSLATIAAMTIQGLDTKDPATFRDENVKAPAIQELLERISVVPRPFRNLFHTRVKVLDTAGRAVWEENDTSTPMADRELEARRLRSKLRTLSHSKLLESDIAGLINAIEDLEHVSIAGLLSYTSTR